MIAVTLDFIYKKLSICNVHSGGISMKVMMCVHISVYTVNHGCASRARKPVLVLKKGGDNTTMGTIE